MRRGLVEGGVPALVSVYTYYLATYKRPSIATTNPPKPVYNVPRHICHTLEREECVLILVTG